MTRQALVATIHVLGLAALVMVHGCSTKQETCLSGSSGCEAAPLCEDLSFACSGGGVFIGRLADLPGGLDLSEAEGTGGDYVLQNGSVTVVIDEIAEPHGLAPTGGNVIDMGARGGEDDINLIYQIAGILPEDAFAYRSIEVVDRSPEFVALIARGTLDGRDDVEIVTRYELGACDPGLRIRSELYNGSGDPHALVIADTGHWGKRNVLPFAPLPDQGFVQPSFDLVGLQDAYAKYDFVLARAAEDDAPSYGFVSCDRPQVQGVNSTELSALGTGVGLVRPGNERSYERFIMVAQSRDLNDISAHMIRARRQMHGDRSAVRVKAQVVAGGLPLPGTVRRSVLVLSEIVGNDLRRPLTTIVPNSEGKIDALVASQSWLWYDLWSFGRVVASGVVPRTQDPDLGVIEIDLPAQLNVSVTIDGVPSFATLIMQPADEEERLRLLGTWLGEFRECSPWLGSPVDGSPACNLVNLVPQGTDFELPAGRYQLWFTAGPETTLGRVDLEIASGEIQSVDIDLQSLALAPVGWLSADLHVHGGASFDSSIPNVDRVQTFVAHGVDVIASTDHDFVSDYASTVEELGLEDRVVVIGGLETTQLIPHMSVPGSDFPKVIGHFNFWPMKVDPQAPRGGAPWDELVQPGELFERVSPFMGPEGIAMLNHPWDDTQFGRDLGYLRAIGFDPRLPIPSQDDGTANGMLQRKAEGGTRNIDFHLIEVLNGVSAPSLLKTRTLWFSLLSEGYVNAGVSNSDSHELHERLGFGRSYVDSGTDLAGFDVELFNRALKDGKVIAGNGVVVLVTVGQDGGPRRGLGFTPYQPAAGDTLEIEVRAPPWIPVNEVRAIRSAGEQVLASAADLVIPPDPLGSAGLVRYQVSVPLDSLLVSGVDDWLLIEAGMAFEPHADLDDDGVPDTSDNNGDGIVDSRDVEEGEDSGPFESLPDPTDQTDPRYSMTRVLPFAWPYGFSNPMLIDWAGDGYQAPGVGSRP